MKNVSSEATPSQIDGFLKMAPDNVGEVRDRGNRGGAHSLHAFAKHDITQRTRNNHDQDHHESLEMEPMVRFHQAPATAGSGKITESIA